MFGNGNDKGPWAWDHPIEVEKLDDLIEQEVGVEALLPSEVGKWVCEPRWYLAMR
jgi:hypothetical protein